MKTIILPLACLCIFVKSIYAQPTSFESRGVGGGGALFACSINPFTNEMYVACDMSQLFSWNGYLWEFSDFRQIQASKNAPVSFTGDGYILYTIDATGTPDGADRSRPTKSTDRGLTWIALASDPTGGNAYKIFAHQDNAKILVVSDYNTLYGSTDSGKTFSQKYQTTNNNTGLHIAGVFFEGNNIYVGTNEGIIYSTNGGTSFSKLNSSGIPPSEFIISLSGCKQNNVTRFYVVTSNTAYAGMDPIGNVQDYKGIYTLDLNITQWIKKTNGIPVGTYPYFCGTGSKLLDVAYVAGGSDASVPIVYKTTNAGLSWFSVFQTTDNENINTGWSGHGGDRGWSYGEYALGFAVNQSDPNQCMISDYGFVHRGSTGWSQSYLDPRDQNKSSDPTPKGKNYRSIGLENTTCWQVAWIDKDNMYGCFSDIKGVRSTDAGKSWSFNYTGHDDNSMYHLTKNVSNSTLYAATSTVHDMYQSTYLTDARIDNGKGKVLFSNNNGASWQTLHDFQHPVIWLATDSQNPNRLYASVIHSTQGGIYVSNNIQSGVSSTWTKLTNPPRTEGHPFNIRVLNDGSLLCSYSGRRTTNFTASSGVFLSTDGGATWQDRSDANMQYWTKDVVIDPHDVTQNTWYAGVFSGWGGVANNKGGLYKTTNRGTSWTKVHSEMRVTSATFSPSNPDVMYFTSETNGLYYSGNRRSPSPTFTQVASYSFRQPERVFYNPYDSTELWVSSFGNGMKVGKKKPVLITPARVSLTSPVNGDTNQISIVKLIWDSVEHAKDYEIYLSKDSIFSLPYQTTSEPTIISLAVSLGTTYYWKVRGRNGTTWGEWSVVWMFATKPSPPSSPKITYPEDLQEDVPVNIIVTWDSTETTDSYRLKLVRISPTDSTIIDTSGLTVRSFTITGLVAATKYHVTVQGRNRSGEGYRALHSFITEGVVSPPTSVILKTPENNSSPKADINIGIEFEWFGQEPVSEYEIQISTDSNFDSIVFVDSTLTSTYERFRVDEETAYWWRVRARNSKGWGQWSTVWSFFDVIYTIWSVKAEPKSTLTCSITPNPASGTVTFIINNSSNFTTATLTITDVIGRPVYSLPLELSQNKNIFYWNADSHPNGSYFYKVTGSNASTTGQVIVKR